VEDPTEISVSNDFYASATDESLQLVIEQHHTRFGHAPTDGWAGHDLRDATIFLVVPAYNVECLAWDWHMKDQLTLPGSDNLE